MNRYTRKAILAGILLISSVVIAGVSFVPDDQPLGSIAPAALNDATLASGNVVSYVPWFDFGNYHGDLIAAPVAADGSVSLLTPAWRAAQVMNDKHALNDKYWDEGRFIVTWHLDGYPTPFRKSEVDGSQDDYFKPDEDKRMNFIRGDRSEEGNKFRVRQSLLGDIIHSNPVYVGAPRSGYGMPGYVGYALTHANRPGRVYVGANDGLLHAFDAVTGDEVFAYVPTMIFPTLVRYADLDYTHSYFVDGTLTAEDAYFGGAWHTVLVGGLGAGGKGFFALDVTSAAPITDESNDSWGAGSRLLWETHPGTFGAADIGYTYSRASITPLNNGKFGVIVGNGYLSAGGRASLLVLDVEDGSVLRNLVVPDLDANGLSSPTAVDVDGDRIIDVAYAGDLNGNLWRFDLSSEFPGDWHVAYGGKPLLSIAPVNGIPRAIITPPEVGAHPDGGYMVYAGAGRLLAAADADDSGVHHVYGIRDHGGIDPETLPVDENALLQQTLRQVSHPNGEKVRTATNHKPDWSQHHGWRTSLEIESAGTLDRGERVLQAMSLRGGRLQFVSSNPTDGIGYNWLLQLDAMTGGAPPFPVIDINGDGKFSILDNADGNGDGEITEAAEDRVVGEFQQLGLASRPVFATVDATGEAVLINHLSQINQLHEDDPPPADAEDPGIVGGHFDLDVSSQTYAFDDGATDKHQHEWDDSHNTTTVDFFDVLGGFRSVDDLEGMPGASTAKKFFITVANAHLSPAAIIEINGIGFPVKEWRALTKRFLSGNLGTNERFPQFKLGALTPIDEAAGVVRLTSLRITFPQNAIQIGGIHPTQTGCVKGNETSPGGVYRNGALTMQVLDADDVTPHYVFNEASRVWGIPGGGSNKIHELGYAVPKAGIHEIGDGMMYEATIFWHWGGGCYTPANEEDWLVTYQEETGVDHATLGSDDDIAADPPPPPPEEETGEPAEPREESAEQDVTTSRVSSGDSLGRLYWREIMPER